MSDNTTKKSWLNTNQRSVIWLLIGIVLGLVIGISIFYTSYIKSVNEFIDNVQSEENSVTSTDTEAGDGITTYTYEHEILTGEDKESAVAELNKVFDYIGSKSTYFEVQIGESDYNLYLYNSNGEGFAQSADGNYTSVFRNDGKVVKYNLSDETMVVGDDANFLSLIKNAINLVANDTENVDLYHMILEDDTTKEYRIDIKGEEAVKALYSYVSDDYASSMMESLKSEIGNDWEPHVIYNYIIANDKDLQSVCYIVQDGQEYINWVSNGYLEFTDWKLDDMWYTSDYSTIGDDEIYNMLDNVVNELGTIMETYAKENEIDVKPETETENVVEPATETEETTSENIE